MLFAISLAQVLQMYHYGAMILQEQIQSFKQFAMRHEHFIIIGHKEPDGDCIASCLGMDELLKKMGKTTTLIAVGPFKRVETKPYEILFAQSLEQALPQNIDLSLCGLVVVDCATQDRLGEIDLCIKDFDTFIVDHHKTAQELAGSQAIIIPTAPAASFLVQLLFEGVHGEVTKQVAPILFLGICTDTGYFRFLEDNSACVFSAVSRLVAKGANPKTTYNTITGGKDFSTRKLLGVLLSRAQEYFDGKLIITYETLEDTAQYGENGRDSDALYQALLACKNVLAVVNIKQDTATTCTAGLRSRDAVDVSIVASKFGGGGHKNASGLSYETSIEAFIPKLIEEFSKQLV